MIRDLASLLAPLPEQSFLEHFLEKKRLHVSCREPERAVQLLPWATINHIVEWDLLPADRFKVMRAANRLPALMFRQQEGLPRLRAGPLQTLLSQGASLVIDGIDEIVPEIRRLVDAMERRLAHNVGANAYLSFGRGSAFKAHWDSHDVLVLQVHGSKRWRSYGTPIPFPDESNKKDKQDLPTEIVWEDVLEPGDLLYLPRGEVHEAALEGKNSVHLTIRIVPRRGSDFVRWVAKQATNDELFRMDLTRLGGEAALGRHETRLKERLHLLIDSTSLAAYLDSEDQERAPRPLFSIGQDDQLGENTFVVPTLRRRTSLLTEVEGEVAVTIGGEQCRVSATARRVLSILFDRDGLQFGELLVVFRGEMSEETLREAVLELVKRGLAALGPCEFACSE